MERIELEELLEKRGWESVRDVVGRLRYLKIKGGDPGNIHQRLPLFPFQLSQFRSPMSQGQIRSQTPDILISHTAFSRPFSKPVGLQFL